MNKKIRTYNDCKSGNGRADKIARWANFRNGKVTCIIGFSRCKVACLVKYTGRRARYFLSRKRGKMFLYGFPSEKFYYGDLLFITMPTLFWENMKCRQYTIFVCKQCRILFHSEAIDLPGKKQPKN